MVSRQTLGLLACCSVAWPWVSPAAAQQSLPIQPSLPAQQALPAQPPEAQPPEANGMGITIDDLAGPNGPGPARSKGHHWKVEPGYGWWGPGDGFDGGFGGGFDDGFLY